LLDSIDSFIPLTSKFGTIEVYKSQNEIIIRSAFSIAFKALELAFTSGTKNAFLIGLDFSFNFKSIFVSHSTNVQSSSLTFKCDNSSVTGKTLHFTLNILETCLNHLSKSQVISVIAVIIKLPKLCHQTLQFLSYL